MLNKEDLQKEIESRNEQPLLNSVNDDLVRILFKNVEIVLKLFGRRMALASLKTTTFIFINISPFLNRKSLLSSLGCYPCMLFDFLQIFYLQNIPGHHPCGCYGVFGSWGVSKFAIIWKLF